MHLPQIILLAVIGLAFGSFLGALTYRIPKGESIFKGRSKCPHCGKKISWYDNIPLFSYLFLKGKCRHCGKRISPRYFWVEFLTALVFVGTYLLYVFCSNGAYFPVFKSPACTWVGSLSLWSIPFMLLVFLVVIAIFVIDLEHQFIPDELVFIGFTLSFFGVLLTSPETLYIRMLSAFGAGAFLLLIHLFTKGKGMGLGDVKFVLIAGLLLGWPYTPIFLFLAFLTGAVVGIILILTSKAEFRQQIAFGPFLVVSLMATFVLGDKLITLLLP